MATGVKWTDQGSFGKCNGPKTSHPDPGLQYDYEMHLKMSKKIAQLTKVVYALNTKSDEHEASLQALKEAHQEEIQKIFAETRGKILQYKSKMGEEIDMRHQIQSLEDALEKHKKLKDDILTNFEMYKQQVEEREKNMEREHTEKIMALSREMFDIKKEFENNLQHFMEIQRRLEQDKQSAITEMVKINQESESLQEKCNALRGSFNERFQLEEKHKMDIMELNQDIESLKSEKKKLTMDFEKKVSKLQSSHQKELEALKKALQQSVTETLKQWQIEQKKNLHTQETTLQIKLQKLENDLDVKGQKMKESRNQCQKLQELLNTAEHRVQELEKQLQKAEKKSATSNANLKRMDDEMQVLKERLSEQEAEILHKADEIKVLSASEQKALAEVEKLKDQLSELQQQLSVRDQKGNKDDEPEHSQQLKQAIEILTRQKEEHQKRHDDDLKKLKRVAEEEKIRLKEQLMKGLEELVKKHTAEIKAVQTSMEMERKRLQQELQNQLDEIKIKVENERKQLEKEKEALFNRLQDSFEEISKMESLVNKNEKGIDQVNTNTQENHKRLLQEQEQAHCQILQLQEKLKKQNEQHEVRVSALRKEQEKVRDQLSHQMEKKWKEKVRFDCDKLRDRLKKEYTAEKQFALAQLQREKEREMKILQERGQNTVVALETELTDIKKNLKQQIKTSQDALQLLQTQVVDDEKEKLQQELRDVTSQSEELKLELATLQQQTLENVERRKQQEFMEENYQNQLKVLKEDLSKSQREVSELQKEKLILQESTSQLSAELALRNQEDVQHSNREEQQRRSLEEEFKAKHKKETNCLQQNHLKEMQGIVSDFSSSQTRLQAKIVSLETDQKEMEEKFRKRESKPEDIQHISKLQDTLYDRDQTIKRLLDERKFQQIALANSESNISRSFARSPYAGSFTPTMKKKKTEDVPVRVVSVPNLSSYEKSFLGFESNSTDRFPPMTKSPSLDQSLNSTSRPFLQPFRVQQSKSVQSTTTEERIDGQGSNGQDLEQQEWFTKYFSF